MFGTEPELSGIYTASSDGTGQPSGENLLPDPYRLVHGIAELSVAPARDQTLSIRFQNGQETAWVSHLQSRVEVEIDLASTEQEQLFLQTVKETTHRGVTVVLDSAPIPLGGEP